MSDEETPQLEEQQVKSEAPLSEPQVGATPEYKFGPDSPSWAQGKTPEELVQMTESLYTTVQNMQYTQQPTPPTPAPAAPVAHQPTVGTSMPDPSLAYTDPTQYNTQLSAWQKLETQRMLEQQAQPLMQSNAELAKAESKRNPKYADIWAKYGPEIEAQLATVPMQMRIQPSIWDDAAALVAGRHMEDIYKSRNAASGMDTGIMSADGVPGTGTVSSTQSPLEIARAEGADWIQQFKRLPGMSISKLRQRVTQLGYTEDEYVAHYEKKAAMRIHNADAELAQHGVFNG